MEEIGGGGKAGRVGDRGRERETEIERCTEGSRVRPARVSFPQEC